MQVTRVKRSRSQTSSGAAGSDVYFVPCLGFVRWGTMSSMGTMSMSPFLRMMTGVSAITHSWLKRIPFDTCIP